MNYKNMGKTDVTLPEIGLGTWKYRGGIDPLRKGIELGASFIDTAESYGTEQTVGEAVEKCRHRVFVATKVSPRHFRRNEVIKAADNSLRRMRTHYIDLYQLHWPNDTVPIEETMSAMEELVDAGKVRFIGVSNFSVSELKRAQASLSRQRIVSNQVRYGVADRTIETGLLAYCQQNDITIIAYSPLAHGLQNLKARDPRGILDRVATEVGRTAAQVALNWCISKENVVTIPKASSIERVTENCEASGWRLSPEDVRLLDQGIKFRQRSLVEAALRRLARRIFQKFGHSL